MCFHLEDAVSSLLTGMMMRLTRMYHQTVMLKTCNKYLTFVEKF